MKNVTRVRNEKRREKKILRYCEEFLITLESKNENIFILRSKGLRVNKFNFTATTERVDI
jgi:hypothetical protein